MTLFNNLFFCISLQSVLTTWTILMMSLLPFWALIESVVLLFMEDEKALLISSKKILISVQKMNEGLMNLE